MERKPTQEQQAVIDALRMGTPKIEVGSFAGTGKTTLLEMTVEAMPKSTKFLYIVFNKSGETEAKERFARFDNITCKTVDALAYANFPRRDFKIGFYKRQDIERLLNLDAKKAKSTLEKFESFCNGGSLVIEDANVQALWDLIEDGRVDPSFSFIKKTFHLNLALNPKGLPVNRYGKYNVVMIDEFQDTNPVTMEIAKLIKANQYVVVGDKHQSIYGFRGASNVMGRDKEATMLYLTRSFRFNQQIADKANAILGIYKGETNRIIGLSNRNTLSTACMLSRTNATLLATINNLAKNNIGFKTIRNPSELFDLPMSIHAIDAGGKPRQRCAWLEWEHRNFMSTGSFGSFMEFLEESAKKNNDRELISAVNICKKINYETMRHLEEVTIANNNDPAPAKYYLSTIHTAKGLEWDYVKIADDVPDYGHLIARYIYDTYGEIKDSTFKMIEQFREDIKEGTCDESIVEEFNLLYVALTRAKVKCEHPDMVQDMMQENLFEAQVVDAYNNIVETEGAPQFTIEKGELKQLKGRHTDDDAVPSPMEILQRQMA